MPTIAFDVKDENGRAVSAVVVTADGDQLLAPQADGQAVAVDPGEHIFRFTSDGFAAVERSLVLREGEKDRREPIVMVASPRLAPVVVSPVPAPPPPSVPLRISPVSTESGLSAQRVVGLAVGGVGVAGLVVGSVFGLVAKSTYDDAVRYCPSGPPSPCYRQGVTEGGTAHDQATVATVAFVGGGALLAGAAVLYLTAPRDGEVSIGATAFVGGAGVGLRGSW